MMSLYLWFITSFIFFWFAGDSKKSMNACMYLTDLIRNYKTEWSEMKKLQAVLELLNNIEVDDNLCKA